MRLRVEEEQPPRKLALLKRPPPHTHPTQKTKTKQVARVLTEAGVLRAVDHPFLATLYCTLQTDTHLHFVMQYCEGGELYGLLHAQPKKRLREAHVRFYGAEVLAALQYLHLLGVVYRDIKVCVCWLVVWVCLCVTVCVYV